MGIFKKESLTLICLLFISLPTWAQLAVTEATNAAEEQAAVNTLVGQGVTIDNVNVECGSGPDSQTGAIRYAFGSFDGSDSNIGLEAGIVLSSGSALNSEGPNLPNIVTTTMNSGNPPSDAELSSLVSVGIEDICRVTMDVTPLGDTLQFFYVFGSEEYYGFTADIYNDVFGFFISGPNPDGGFYDNVNIATIPDTNPPMPVSINTVNGGCDELGGICPPSPGPNVGEICPCNQLYYIDNDFTGGATSVQYRGFTRPLTALARVVPCETYTLKLAIADGFDNIFDSGVFIEAGSLSSKNVGVSSSTGYSPFGDDQEITVEDCVPASIYFEFPFDIYADANVYYSIIPCESGQPAAVNGDDFAFVDGILTVPEGASLDSIFIEMFEDNTFEGIECFAISVDSIEIDGCTFDLGGVTEVVIYDQLITELVVDSIQGPICPGTPVPLNVAGGLAYEWSPASAVSDPNIKNPIATVFETTELECYVQVNACVDTYRVEIIVADLTPPETDTLYALCEDDPVPLVAGDGALAYIWTPIGPDACTDCLSCTVCQDPVFTPNGSSLTYDLAMIVDPGCDVHVEVEIIYDNPGFLAGPENVSKCAEDDIDVDITGGVDGTYVWTPSDGLSCSTCPNPTISVTSPTTYEITADNIFGCSDAYTLTVDVLSNTAAAGEDFGACNEVNSIIGLPEINGVTYTWSPSTGLSDTSIAQPVVNLATLNGQNQSVTYSVNLQDANGCDASDEVTITAYAEPFISIPEDSLSIVIGQVATCTASGAGALGTYEWSPMEGLTASTGASISARPLLNTWYYVEGFNEFGCSAIDSIFIEVVEPPVLIFPNAFSPNGDDINETLRPYTKDIIEIRSTQVFDRWGNLVWRGTGLGQEWDGRYQDTGEPAPLGVYVFFCEYIQLGEEDLKIYRDNVSLIR